MKRIVTLTDVQKFALQQMHSANAAIQQQITELQAKQRENAEHVWGLVGADAGLTLAEPLGSLSQDGDEAFFVVEEDEE